MILSTDTPFVRRLTLIPSGSARDSFKARKAGKYNIAGRGDKYKGKSKAKGQGKGYSSSATKQGECFQCPVCVRARRSA